MIDTHCWLRWGTKKIKSKQNRGYIVIIVQMFFSSNRLEFLADFKVENLNF